MVLRKPLDVFFEITRRCNLRCIHCTYPHEPSAPFDMDMSALERIAAIVLPEARSVIFYGGEPMAHNNFFNVLETVNRYHVPFVGFFTNGLLLDHTAAKRIVSTGVNRLAISIDGATKVTYESIRRRASFDELLANVNTFNRVKALNHTRLPLLGFNFVIMRRNVAEMPMLVELASIMGVDIINFNHLNLHPFLALEGEALLSEEATGLYNRSLDEALRVAKRRGIQVFAPPPFTAASIAASSPERGRFRKYADSVREHAGAIWPVIQRQAAGVMHRMSGARVLEDRYILCRTPWEILEVKANGDVDTCFCGRRSRVGSLLTQTFDEIWRGEEFQALRRSLSGVTSMDGVCRKCGDRPGNKVSDSVFHGGIFGVDFWGYPEAGSERRQ